MKSDLEWEIEFQIDELNEKIDWIFGRCRQRIHHAYSPLKIMSRQAREKIREDKIFNMIDDALKDCHYILSQSDDYQTMVTFLLDTVYNGYSEGFGDWMLDINDRDLWPVTALIHLEAQHYGFDQLVGMYNDQLCEAYR